MLIYFIEIIKEPRFLYYKKGGAMVHRTQKTYDLGNLLRYYRESIDLGNGTTTRLKLIEYGCTKFSYPEDWISEKGLQNLELGHNVPSIKTVKLLAAVYQIEFSELIEEIVKYV